MDGETQRGEKDEDFSVLGLTLSQELVFSYDQKLEMYRDRMQKIVSTGMN